MAPGNQADTSDAARQRGNDFYKQGNFYEAEKAYQKAIELALDDAAPWSNLSAVKFETGQYKDAVDMIQKALSLLSSEPDGSPKKQKLYGRMAKCYLHSIKLDDVDKAIAVLHEGSAQEGASPQTLRYVADTLRRVWSVYPEESSLRQVTYDRLPRYKPCLLDVPEYYAIGHDTAQSLIDQALRGSGGGRDKISLLLCGSGDGRHLFGTLLDATFQELLSQTTVAKHIHITILDLKAAALARTVLVFDMLVRFAIMKKMKTPGHEDALIVISYLYTSQFLPPFVVEKLQEQIASLIVVLEGDEDPLPFIYIPRATKDEMIHVLKQWQQPLPEIYNTAYMRNLFSQAHRESALQAQENFGATPPTPKGCEPDRKSFDELTIILPDDAFIKRREPELLELSTAYRKGRKLSANHLASYIDSKWILNFTFLDMDFEARRVEAANTMPFSPFMSEQENARCRRKEMDPTVDFDPLKLTQAMTHLMPIPPGKPGVIGQLGAFFENVGLAIMMFTDRLHIEAFTGEMADVMERIRHDALDHRRHKQGERGNEGLDPSKFPKLYDRIHLSNIPDYVGGLLTALTYSRPLLRDKDSNVRFNNLLNPPMFESHENFQAEYLLMYDEKRIENHFCLRRQKLDNLAVDPMAPPAVTTLLNMGKSFLVEDYFIWDALPLSPIPRKFMMPRSQFEHWTYGHLLKICLPYPRELISHQPVHAPLNLTAFPRILVHMFERGYPAHWLSGIVATVCEGTLTTTARAPRTVVLHRDDINQTHSRRPINVTPWKAEFTTVMSIWQRMLPFGIIAPTGGLVHPETIGEYSITFPKVDNPQLRVPHFMLIFWNTKLGKEYPPTPIRCVLLDDENADLSNSAKEIREDGVHVVTIFKYVTNSRTAMFWLRRDIIDEMVKEGTWKVYIWRTDNWERVTDGVKVIADIGPKRLWTEA